MASKDLLLLFIQCWTQTIVNALLRSLRYAPLQNLLEISPNLHSLVHIYIFLIFCGVRASLRAPRLIPPDICHLIPPTCAR